MARISAELRPQLQQAQEKLAHALHEACAMDLQKANTSELIHIDELLAIAGDSAKKAISVRRRLRKDSSKSRSSVATATVAGGQRIASSAHRMFEDARSVRWTAFAVYPSKSTIDHARLPGPFQTGWLWFNSGPETRRLTPIPERWTELSDDELRQLCERAMVAPRRDSKDGPAN